MPFDIVSFTKSFPFALTMKIALLTLIGLYAIFSFMLSIKIRSFNKIVFLPPSSGAVFIQVFAYIYFFVVLSLFFLALVIV